MSFVCVSCSQAPRLRRWWKLPRSRLRWLWRLSQLRSRRWKSLDPETLYRKLPLFIGKGGSTRRRNSAWPGIAGPPVPIFLVTPAAPLDARPPRATSVCLLHCLCLCPGTSALQSFHQGTVSLHLVPVPQAEEATGWLWGEVPYYCTALPPPCRGRMPSCYARPEGWHGDFVTCSSAQCPSY